MKKSLSYFKRLKKALGLGTDELRNRLVALEQKISRLQSIVDFSVIRDVRLIEFNHDYYFHYTADALGQDWMSATREASSQVVAERKERWSRVAHNKPALPSLDEFLTQRPNAYVILTPLMLHFLKHQPDFQFVDVGANIGITSMPIARLIKDSGCRNRIYAFEPGHVAELFSWNVRLNAVDDIVEAISMAVSNVNGVVPIKSLAHHSESASLQDFTRHYPQLFHSEIRLVPVVKLDDFVALKGITAPLFVKIDAEGEDCQVVEGMKRSISAGQILGAMVEITGKYMTEAQFLQLASTFSNFAMVNMRSLDKAGTHGFNESIVEEDLRKLYQQVAVSPHGWTDLLFLNQSIPELSTLIARLQGWR